MASATFHYTLNARPKADGSHAVLLRITYNRQHKYIATGVYCARSHWNPNGEADKQNVVRKSHPQHSQLNAMLFVWLTRCRTAVAHLLETGQPVTADAIKQQAETPVGHACFGSFCREKLQAYRLRGQHSTADAYRLVYHTLCDYMGVDRATGRLPFAALTTPKLMGLEVFLLNKPVRASSKLRVHARHNYIVDTFSKLRQLLGWFMAQQHIQQPNPLSGYTKKRKYQPPDVLTQGELIRWASVEVPDTVSPRKNRRLTPDVARRLYLCSYFLHGLRVGDLLNARVEQLVEDEQGGYRFVTISRKAGKSKRIKIEPVILDMLLKSAADKTPEMFLFDVLPQRRRFDTGNRLRICLNDYAGRIDKLLPEVCAYLQIPKYITMHTARHSFASKLYETTRDIRLVSEAVSHSSMTTTEKYIRQLTSAQRDAANVAYDFAETMLKHLAKQGETNLAPNPAETAETVEK